MFQNLLGNIAAKFVGKWLDGYKFKIGAVATIIGFLPVVVAKFWPELNLQVPDQDWSAIINGIMEACQKFGPAVAGAGIVHKIYKAGLNTPVPGTTTPQPIQEAPATSTETQGPEPGAPSGSGGFTAQ